MFCILNGLKCDEGTENLFDGKLLFVMGTLTRTALDVPNKDSQLIDTQGLNGDVVCQSGLRIAQSKLKLHDRGVFAANS